MQSKKNPARAAVVLLAGVLAVGTAAAASGSAPAPLGANDPSATSPRQAGARSRARAKAPRVRSSPPSSSAETPAQRERRLIRECRGLPNAGACLGYARR
ncbi:MULTISPECIES: hypothetical protein [Comamonadaceae]|uniref:hypothetical protein n=1 Tax=Acidovorax sacchari TaxID=3230736 RepID=UPI0034A53161